MFVFTGYSVFFSDYISTKIKSANFEIEIVQTVQFDTTRLHFLYKTVYQVMENIYVITNTNINNNYMERNMNKRKIWQEQEDRIISEEVEKELEKNGKISWTLIANRIKNQVVDTWKTAKQCRERYHSRLRPQIKKNIEWSQEQQSQLFKLHNLYGNKWALISSNISGRSDNCIKNHFYCTLRKGLRKINKYISSIKKNNPSLKEFKAQTINKIMAVVDDNYQVKLEVKEAAISLSKRIKNYIIQISRIADEQSIGDYSALMDQVVKNIQQFNKNCKKRKGNRRKDDYFIKTSLQDYIYSSSQNSNQLKQDVIPMNEKKPSKFSEFQQRIQQQMLQQNQQLNNQQNYKNIDKNLTKRQNSRIQTGSSSVLYASNSNTIGHNSCFQSQFLKQMLVFTSDQSKNQLPAQRNDQFFLYESDIPLHTFSDIMMNCEFEGMIKSLEFNGGKNFNASISSLNLPIQESHYVIGSQSIFEKQDAEGLNSHSNIHQFGSL